MSDKPCVPDAFVPASLYFPLGEFIVTYGALDGELNRLIWHVSGASPDTGAAFTASIPQYRARAQLLIWLSTRVTNSQDRNKLEKLAKRFMSVSDYRHRVIHDQVGWISPRENSVGIFRAETQFTKHEPNSISKERLRYMTQLSWTLYARMQQYQF